MSKTYYLRCTYNSLPKFASRTKSVQAGNGKYVNTLLAIAVMLDIQGHRFEVYTLDLEIHEN